MPGSVERADENLPGKMDILSGLSFPTPGHSRALPVPVVRSRFMSRHVNTLLKYIETIVCSGSNDDIHRRLGRVRPHDGGWISSPQRRGFFSAGRWAPGRGSCLWGRCGMRGRRGSTRFVRRSRGCGSTLAWPQGGHDSPWTKPHWGPSPGGMAARSPGTGSGSADTRAG